MPIMISISHISLSNWKGIPWLFLPIGCFLYGLFISPFDAHAPLRVSPFLTWEVGAEEATLSLYPYIPHYGEEVARLLGNFTVTPALTTLPAPFHPLPSLTTARVDRLLRYPGGGGEGTVASSP